MPKPHHICFVLQKTIFLRSTYVKTNLSVSIGFVPDRRLLNDLCYS